MKCRVSNFATILPMLAACFILACQTNVFGHRDDGITTVILVRHAEKELTGDDPDLTDLGTERAVALARVVGEANVSAIYSTPYARTRNTAAPLAELLGIDVSEISPGSTYASDMADLVRTRHRGETVVVVSHSNTVPAIIGELGASPIPVIDEDEYDDLYVVSIAPSGNVGLLPLRYGSETP